MQDKRQNNKNQKKSHRSKSALNETFALAGGKKDPRTGATIPSEEGVIAAKKFVEKNKK